MRGRLRTFTDTIKDRINLHASYEDVFNTEPGKRVLAHICKAGNVFSACHVPGDPHTSALNEGKRILALSILRFARKNHKELLQQIEEQYAKDTPVT